MLFNLSLKLIEREQQVALEKEAWVLRPDFLISAALLRQRKVKRLHKTARRIKLLKCLVIF